MTFRDESEALRARAEALEAELAARVADAAEKDRRIAGLERLLAGGAEAPPAPLPVADSEAPLPWWRTSGRALAASARELGVAGVLGVVVGLSGVIVGVGAAFVSCSTADTSAPSTVLPAPTVAVRSGRVARIEGRAPVTPGTPCEVRVVSQYDHDRTCRAEVRCGGAALYGAAPELGFLRCTFTPDKQPVSGLDDMDSVQDHDPRLLLELRRDLVEVSEGGSADGWTVTLALAPGAG